MVTVTMKELLEAGVHFGHQVRRWNPKMKEYIFGERNGIYKMTKKERIKLDRERESLTKNLAGIKSMARLPDAVFIIDVKKEEIAVAEANRLGIPVVAVVDTNCSPEGVDYVIPGNDDALRAVRLFASRIADAVLEGQQMGTEGGEEVESGAQTETATEVDGRKPRTGASSDNTSSVTTSIDPGRESTNAADMGDAAPSTETQTSVPGNQGFGRTGQQPDSVGDHTQAGTGAPVTGAPGGGENESELQPSSSPEADKGAESVGVAS
ncbi:MAG: 30S ribosomal protein S2 [Acidobacteria bacterium]|nr:30S ribosomal protein S2 [Acidobacteriota bacterium]